MSTDLLFKHIDVLLVAGPVAHVVALWPDPFEVALLQLADDLQLVGRCRSAVTTGLRLGRVVRDARLPYLRN